MAAWLDPALAGRLEAAGIVTLVQLVERIKAQRIVEWLRGHEATIGLAIGPAPEIRPLEKFVMPADLDGIQGLRRRPQAQSLLAASNDYQLILAWLRSKERAEPGAAGEARGAAPGPTDAKGEAGLEQPFDWLQTLSNTQRAYRKEAERFLLWAIVDRGQGALLDGERGLHRLPGVSGRPATGKPLVRRAGARALVAAVAALPGQLLFAAQRQAIAILKNLYGFLVDQNYLMGNPWSAVGVPTNPGRR